MEKSNDESQSNESQAVEVEAVEGDDEDINPSKAGKKRPFDAPSEEKLAERRAANRRSAFQSRQRRKILIEDLQKTVASLSKDNADLRKTNEDLRFQMKFLLLENKQIRQQLQASVILSSGHQPTGLSQILNGGGGGGSTAAPAPGPVPVSVTSESETSNPSAENSSSVGAPSSTIGLQELSGIQTLLKNRAQATSIPASGGNHLDALRGILGGGAAGPQNGISPSLLESLTRQQQQQQQQSSMTELQRAILRGAATTTTTDPATTSLSPSLSSSLNQSLIGRQSNLSNNSMAVSIALQNLLQKKQGT